MTLLSYLAGSESVSVRPSYPDAMTNTALEATALSSGTQEKIYMESYNRRLGIDVLLVLYRNNRAKNTRNNIESSFNEKTVVDGFASEIGEVMRSVGQWIHHVCYFNTQVQCLSEQMRVIYLALSFSSLICAWPAEATTSAAIPVTPVIDHPLPPRNIFSTRLKSSIAGALRALFPAGGGLLVSCNVIDLSYFYSVALFVTHTRLIVAARRSGSF